MCGDECGAAAASPGHLLRSWPLRLLPAPGLPPPPPGKLHLHPRKPHPQLPAPQSPPAAPGRPAAARKACQWQVPSRCARHARCCWSMRLHCLQVDQLPSAQERLTEPSRAPGQGSHGWSARTAVGGGPAAEPVPLQEAQPGALSGPEPAESPRVPREHTTRTSIGGSHLVSGSSSAAQPPPPEGSASLLDSLPAAAGKLPEGSAGVGAPQPGSMPKSAFRQPATSPPATGPAAAGLAGSSPPDKRVRLMSLLGRGGSSSRKEPALRPEASHKSESAAQALHCQLMTGCLPVHRPVPVRTGAPCHLSSCTSAVQCSQPAACHLQFYSMGARQAELSWRHG